MKRYILLLSFLVCIGLMDAAVIHIFYIHPFLCNFIHGALLGLYVLENWSMLQDLKQSSETLKDLESKERLVQRLRIRISDLHGQLLEAKADKTEIKKKKFILRTRCNNIRTWHNLWDTYCLDSPPS